MPAKNLVAISSPGKVLLAGGYLVVDREYTGLVFGLDARIHVLAQKLETTKGVSLSEIIVRSPQFTDAEWRYGYRSMENGGGIEVTQLTGHSTSGQSRNKFVETALAYALTYIASKTAYNIHPASIIILADTDYYSESQGWKQADSSSKWRDFHIPLNEVHKTGLGSSAALVTAFIAAFLSHYLPSTLFDVHDADGKAKLHNLAQAAHSHAQGKIGSGFDVAAAVYGSCVYRRFSPLILERIGDIGMAGFSERLGSTTDDDGQSKMWDLQIEKDRAVVPKALRLLMCDVDCGSETPGMVKRIFSWRKEHPEEAALLWATLQKANEDFAAELQRLSNQDADSSSYQELREIILNIRSLVREMSSKANVPIEPEVITELLDACSSLPGVLGGLAPGAGGFDAVVLVVEDHPEVVESLQKFLDNYQATATEVEGEKTTIGKVKLLGVKQEMEGTKSELTSTYEKWLERL
ncbi:MAG: phosphomevalonate kinase [Icmadophila ericetorum]|nr:phosphomevalonate kinase [Icmadophila ericetorum]